MSSFHDLTIFLIIITLLICIVLGKSVTKKDLFTIDGMFSFIGCIFGIFMTLLNLRYTSNELFLLSPLIGITCIIYLRFRSILFSNSLDFLDLNVPLNGGILKCINIFYWCFFSLALISYVKSPLYHRSLSFFVFTSMCISLIGMLTIYSNKPTKIDIFNIFLKIFLISLMLSASGFFISSYPVGSDPWAHLEYIKDYLRFNHLAISGDTSKVGEYYLNYPMSHLFSIIVSLIVNLDPRFSFYMIGIVLILSTLFTYLFVKEVCNNSNIALFSVLLISFASFQIRWTITIIAMSFGLAIYSIIIYLMIKSHSTNKPNKIKYQLLLIFFIFIIIWTHTISAFITLITILCLYISSLMSQKILYLKVGEKLASSTLCVTMIVTLIFHWTDKNYSFFDLIINRLSDSLVAEAKFLDLSISSNIIGRYGMLLLTFGFLINTFFGIIGSLSTISKFHSFPTQIHCSLQFSYYIFSDMFFRYWEWKISFQIDGLHLFM